MVAQQNNKEQPKEYKTVQEWEQSFFKDPNSRKEKVTHVYTHTTVWLVENGQKVKEIQSQKNSNTTTDILSFGSSDNFQTGIERMAIQYAESTVISRSENMPEAYGTEELWKEMIINFLKTQPLNYISKYLEHLKGLNLDWTAEVVDDLMEKLNDWMISLYKIADEGQKKIFKQRMETKFSNSRILKEIK